ncbi:TRAP transporter small permease [Pseudalkalibacillus caeni]|uniref:TRAP transporter small permease n=1 Tax=Exobacillus caeni TaxID=2574798 RepID=A0A5R9F9W4_9BACL|nr:TRAP transporter small permease [Pseudalkalibacillus caeni]TLS38428.1 TRAP transporter small permease [Pseudalkalibacillus caeni]
MLLLLKGIDAINKVLRIVVAVLLIIMSIVIAVQVFSRFILGNSITWSEELARYLMIWLVFLASSLALRMKALIGVEAISERLSFKARRFLKTIVHALNIAFFVFLLIKGVEMLGHVQTQSSPAMHISMAWAYAAIPVGSFLMIINSIAVLIEFYKGGGE